MATSTGNVPGAKFKIGDRVRRTLTSMEGKVLDVQEDKSQVIARVWYSVEWDGDQREDVVWEGQLEAA